MRDWGTLLTVAERVSRQWTKGQDDHPGVLWPGLEGVLDMLAANRSDCSSEVAALAMEVVGEWWQSGATGGGVQRADRARAMVWRDWPELAELLCRLVAAEKGVRWEPHFPPLASVTADGAVQRDPLARIARALELCAVTATFKVAPSNEREGAWRAMLALVREIEGDVTGPQDVVRQRRSTTGGVLR